MGAAKDQTGLAREHVEDALRGRGDIGIGHVRLGQEMAELALDRHQLLIAEDLRGAEPSTVHDGFLIQCHDVFHRSKANTFSARACELGILKDGVEIIVRIDDHRLETFLIGIAEQVVLAYLIFLLNVF